MDWLGGHAAASCCVDCCASQWLQVRQTVMLGAPECVGPLKLPQLLHQRVQALHSLQSNSCMLVLTSYAHCRDTACNCTQKSITCPCWAAGLKDGARWSLVFNLPGHTS
jgi:hypothetical protein